MSEPKEMNDFLDRLLDFLKSLELTMPVELGLFEEKDTVAVAPMQGGLVLTKYYNGMTHKRLPYEIGIKVFENQPLALTTLNLIANRLANLKDIPSQNDSYELVSIQISSEPFYRGQDVEGYFFYRLEIEVDLNLKK